MSEPTAGLRPLRVLRANAAWILLSVAVVALGSWFVSGKITPTYAATASVVLEPRVAPNTTPVALAMATEKQLVTSGVVLDQAARQLAVPADTLVKQVAVAVPADANVLDVSCHLVDPVRAQRCANLVAHAYVEYRNQSADSKAGSGIIAAVVTEAILPSHPENNSRSVVVAIGLVVGVTLGVGTAFVRDLLSPRLRGAEDFAARAGVVVLGVLPRIRRWRHGVAAEYAARLAPDSALTEAFRYLRVRLVAKVGPLPGKLILVTSASHGEGRSSVAANLVTVLARSGLNVLLVDVDPLRPSQHRIFDVDPSLGFAELVEGRADVQEVLRPSAILGLSVIAGASTSSLSADMLALPRTASVISSLREHADVVVLDSGPLLRVADAAALAPLSDVVLLVADARRSNREAVTAAGAQLSDTGVPMFGILNDMPAPAAGSALVGGRRRGRWSGGRAASRRHVSSGGWFIGGPVMAPGAAAAAAGADPAAGASADPAAGASADPAAPGGAAGSADAGRPPADSVGEPASEGGEKPWRFLPAAAPSPRTPSGGRDYGLGTPSGGSNFGLHTPSGGRDFGLNRDSFAGAPRANGSQAFDRVRWGAARWPDGDRSPSSAGSPGGDGEEAGGGRIKRGGNDAATKPMPTFPPRPADGKRPSGGKPAEGRSAGGRPAGGKDVEN